jgi:hypothetical protein
MKGILYTVYEFVVKWREKRNKTRKINERAKNLLKTPCVTPIGMSGRPIRRLDEKLLL